MRRGGREGTSTQVDQYMMISEQLGGRGRLVRIAWAMNLSVLLILTLEKAALHDVCPPQTQKFRHIPRRRDLSFVRSAGRPSVRHRRPTSTSGKVIESFLYIILDLLTYGMIVQHNLHPQENIIKNSECLPG